MPKNKEKVLIRDKNLVSTQLFQYGGAGEIWTLARLFTYWWFSRPFPSAAWVLLQKKKKTSHLPWGLALLWMVGTTGLEPVTFRTSSGCSPSWAKCPKLDNYIDLVIPCQLFFLIFLVFYLYIKKKGLIQYCIKPIVLKWLGTS